MVCINHHKILSIDMRIGKEMRGITARLSRRISNAAGVNGIFTAEQF